MMALWVGRRPAGRGRWASLAAVLLLAACSLTTYRMDIQQGNVVTQEMISKLRPGMTRSQVKFVMGTPLVSDPFHTERWDYFYELIKQGKLKDRRRLTLLFEDDQLKKVLGDVEAAPGLKGEPVPASAADK